MEHNIQQALDQCLKLLEEGGSLEECLAKHPESAAELRPLLWTALAARRGLVRDMPPSVGARICGRVLAEWDRSHQRSGWRWRVPALVPRWAPRWAVALASVFLVVIFGGMGTVAASANAVPGSLLYPVKEVREEASLWFARSPEAKVAAYTRLVKERAEEVRALAASKKDRSEAINIALGRLHGHLTSLNTLVDENVQGQRDDSVHAVSGLQKALQGAARTQEATQSLLQGALGQAPEEAQPDVRRALESVQQAREKVRAALEAVGTQRGE